MWHSILRGTFKDAPTVGKKDLTLVQCKPQGVFCGHLKRLTYSGKSDGVQKD